MTPETIADDLTALLDEIDHERAKMHNKSQGWQESSPYVDSFALGYLKGRLLSYIKVLRITK